MRRGRVGRVVYVVLAAAMFAAPVLLSRPWTPDESAASAAGDPDTTRLVTEVDAEGWASEGFAGLAAEFAARPEAPTWDEVRRAMERRGCVDLRYALTIRFLFNDGNTDIKTYIRQPYRQPEHAEEFLHYLRGGPEAAWTGPGEPS